MKSLSSHILQDTTVSLLTQHIHCEPITIGSDSATAYMPSDLDVSPFDNGKTKKEGVSRTDKGCDGMHPSFPTWVTRDTPSARNYVKANNTHKKNTPAFLRQSLQRAHLLVRGDSGNDAWDNMVVCRAEQADFLIKRNLRRESLGEWVTLARLEGHHAEPRKGKNSLSRIHHAFPSSRTRPGTGRL